MVAAPGGGGVRIGQTSAIHFGSRVVSSVAGFVATLYIAQELGSAALGTYAVFVATVIWLKTIAGVGFQRAIRKRLSEAGGSARDLGAGLVVQAGAYAVVAVAALALARPLNDYLRFEGTTLLVGVLGIALVFSTITATLEGEEKVHVAAILGPLDRVVRSAVQLAVVFVGVLGGGVVGLVWGYAAGVGVAAIVGVLFVGVGLGWPRREHFERILGFARYSWLSGIEGRSFSSMDTVVLGVFVLPELIGFYEVAWNLASILAVFATSIGATMFPALSRLSSEDEDEVVAGLVNDALAYTGLFIIPGLVGALVLGERVLAIYGPEFRQAGTVLVVLVFARLVYAYEAQFITTLDAVDRPDAAFRVNVVFVVVNLALNVLLVFRFGWYGAAVATTLAAALGLVLAYRAITSIVSLDLPLGEIARQWLAAGAMGAVVYSLERLVRGTFSPPMYGTLLLVGTGAVVYFVVLAAISRRFRTTVADNLPVA